MLHVICVALNYWYYGGEFVPEELLRREPNSAHKLLYSRVRSYVRADGLMESFDVLHVGRKNPNLVARLSELTAQLGQSCNQIRILSTHMKYIEGLHELSLIHI